MPRKSRIDVTTPHWLYLGKPLVVPPEGYFGFVYCITHLRTGKRYIGRKQFYSRNRKRVPGRVNRRHVVKESDWKKYWSSCIELREAALAQPKKFKREILKLCVSKADLGYSEVEMLIKNDVLTATLADGSPAYYNRNIMNRWFAKDSTEK